MGGTKNGQLASMKIIKDFATWFRDLDLSTIPKTYDECLEIENNSTMNNPIYAEITKKLRQINDELESNDETKDSFIFSSVIRRSRHAACGGTYPRAAPR